MPKKCLYAVNVETYFIILSLILFSSSSGSLEVAAVESLFQNGNINFMGGLLQEKLYDSMTLFLNNVV